MPNSLRQFSFLSLCLLSLGASAAPRLENPLPPSAAPKGGLGLAAPAPLRVITAERRVEVDATIALRGTDTLPRTLLAESSPGANTLLATAVTAAALQTALARLQEERVAPGSAKSPASRRFRVDVAWRDENGSRRRLPLERMLLDADTGKPLTAVEWRLARGAVAGGRERSIPLLTLDPKTAAAVLIADLPAERLGAVRQNTALLPKAGVRITLLFAPASL